MLKIKPIIFGLASSIIIFLLLICAVSFATLNLGVIHENILLGIAQGAMVFAVLAGSFISSSSAGGRGLVYGGIISLLWIILTLIVSAMLGVLNVTGSIFIKYLIVVLCGSIGGILGANRKSRNSYI